MINSIIFQDTVNVLRRDSSASVDALNNPNYGAPTSWPAVYTGIKIRIAYSGKQIQIKSTGELVYPTASIYYSTAYTLKPMDRIITVSSPGNISGIEYVIESIYPAMLMSNVVSHMEGNIHLPI